jgi:hypothetical protein
MIRVWFSEPAENELCGFSMEDAQYVADAANRLLDGKYRERNKIDINHKENGFNIYGLADEYVWLSFHIEPDGDICIDWVSLRSKFRRFIY